MDSAGELAAGGVGAALTELTLEAACAEDGGGGGGGALFLRTADCSLCPEPTLLAVAEESLLDRLAGGSGVGALGAYFRGIGGSRPTSGPPCCLI